MKPVLMSLCFWTLPLLANAEPHLGLGFKGGGNAAILAENNRFNRYGLTGGFEGYLRNPLTEQLSLGGQVELLYTPRGAKAILDGEYLGQFRYHYIDVMAAVRPEVRLGSVSVYLLLGGGVNVLVNANKENASGVPQDTTDGLHRIDVALLGAAGLVLHLPSQTMGPFRLGTVFLEARHDVGLIGTDLMIGGYKNRTSSLMLGLSFAVGGPSSAVTSVGPAE
jgi:hypothetical protein